MSVRADVDRGLEIVADMPQRRSKIVKTPGLRRGAKKRLDRIAAVRTIAPRLRKGRKFASPRRRVPCTCMAGCLKCGMGRALPTETALAMYADYQSGMTLAAVARKHGRKSGGQMRELFERRGFKLRPAGKAFAHQFGNGGCFQAAQPATAAQITAALEKMTKIGVPPELKLDWRKWSMARRRAFIARLRVRLNIPGMPTGPYSKNVTPFEYGTPAAMAFEERMNAGRNSQTKVIKIKPSSQGVIWQDMLWFWFAYTRNSTNGSYQRGQNWNPETGRRMLNHVIWATANKQPVPPKMTVIHLDGNKNNLDPKNLACRSMADCARANSVMTRLKADPQNPQLLQIAERRSMRMIQTRLKNSRDRADTLIRMGASTLSLQSSLLKTQ